MGQTKHSVHKILECTIDLDIQPPPTPPHNSMKPAFRKITENNFDEYSFSLCDELKKLSACIDDCLNRKAFEIEGDSFCETPNFIVNNAFKTFLRKFDNVKTNTLGLLSKRSNIQKSCVEIDKLDKVMAKICETVSQLSAPVCENRSSLLKNLADLESKKM